MEEPSASGLPTAVDRADMAPAAEDAQVLPLLDPPQPDPAPARDRNKKRQILNACHSRDHAALSLLASSAGGLVDDETRRQAWPILIGCSADDIEKVASWSSLKQHRDEEQVDLDVNRSFVYYPENESQEQIKARRRELSDLIVGVLRRHPLLCYFQGYHDIIQVFLLVLGAEQTEKLIARLSLLRIRDFMLPTLAGAEAHLHLLPAILYVADSELHKHLLGATFPTPFFALAPTLTLYAHDIEEYGDIARLFDFLLASEAVVPIYLFAVIVKSRKKELLEIEPDEPEMLHSVLSKLPKPLDLEDLIQQTRTLVQHHPPEQLPWRVWARISASSALKTTHHADRLATQTLAQGEAYFRTQAAEIARQEQWQRRRLRARALVARYRRPAGWTGAALLVAVLALYLGRSSTSSPVVAAGAEWTGMVWTLQQRLGEVLRSLRS